MPIPLGILAAAGFAPAGGGSYDLLETSILSSSAASVTFSNLGNYASDYQHLQIRTVLQSTTGVTISLRMNGDTGSNYTFHRLEGNGSSVYSNAGTGRNNIALGTSSDTGSIFSPFVVDILDPYQSKNKTVRSFARANGVGLYSGMWINTASLTSLTIFAETGQNLVTNSRFSLYGLRKV